MKHYIYFMECALYDSKTDMATLIVAYTLSLHLVHAGARMHFDVIKCPFIPDKCNDRL